MSVRDLQLIALSVDEEDPMEVTAVVSMRMRLDRPGTIPRLEVDPEGKWFIAPNGPRIDLSRRRALRLILGALVERRRADPGRPMPPDEILAAGWPGERVLPEAAAYRVYTAIRTLRRMGLLKTLLTVDGGYVLDPVCPITS